MKSKWILAAIIVCLLTGLSCTRAQPQAATLTMTVPSWYDPANLPALAAVIDQWNANHPQSPITVRTLVGKREAMLQKMLLGSRRNEMGDIALVRNEWIGRLQAENLIEPLPAAAAAAVRARSLPALLPAVADESQVWAWPFDADALVVWQRSDLIPVSVWDFAGFAAAVAQTAKSDTAQRLRAVFAFPAARATNSALAFLPWYFSFGGELTVANDRLTFDPAIAAQALQRLYDLPGRIDNPAALEQNDVFSGLAGGAYALTIGGSWERPMLARQSRLTDKIVARLLPGPQGEGSSLLGGWSFVRLQKARKSAAQLMVALGGEDVQRAKLHDSGLLPATRATLADPWFADNVDGPTLKSALQHGRSLPLHPHTLAALEPIAVMVAATFLGKKDPATAAAEAAQAIAADAKKPATPPTPVPTALEAVCPDGTKTIWPQDKLRALPRQAVGDRQLVPLTAFCPDATNARAEIHAADGYAKVVSASGLRRGYLDPDTLTMILVRDDGDAFTVRDTARIVFSAASKPDGLLLSMSEKRRIVSAAELKSLATDGRVPFSAILALPGWELNPDDPVVLIAKDGYKKEILLPDLQKGHLVLEGMRCEFNGLSSKHQIRNLSEVRLP